MRAKPVIIGGLLASVATLPLPVLALGLGKLTVTSGLGQPLSAQIELTAASREELDSLRARIADPSTYRDNNVQYSPALGRARITLEQGSNGTPYLRVTTTQAVNDPFLDMIVELSWATGRVVRDYTFLLDPPGGETQAVEPAPAIVAQTAPARAPRSTAAPRGGAPARAASGAAAPASGAAAPSTGSSGASADASGGYTVQRGDTLSKIAREYKPDNVSLEQMLVALFRSNENAFDGRNMNRLRTGQIITIPPADQTASITQADANSVVKAQSADWRAYRDRVAAAAPTTDTTAPRQATGGRIGTVVEDKAAPAAAGSDKLMVSRAAGKGGGTGAGSAKAEDAAAKDKALREANERVAELEKTVRDLQRAAELRNQTMADLQARAGELNKGKADGTKSAPMAAAPTTPTASATATSAPATTAAAPASPPASTLTPVPPTPAPATATPPPAVPPTSAAAPATTAPAAPPSTASTPSPPATSSAPPATPPATVAPAAPPAPSETKAADATPPAPKVVTPPKKAAPEPSFFDDLLGNTPTWAMAGGALVVLAGIAGLVAARRRKTTKFEDSIISGTDIKTNTVFGSTGGGVVNTGDNSLASDFSREGLGNIDTDEVDPIAEAEVYLAYGRDAQAEEILKDALKKDSQRQEIYLKLLEIHSQHNKPSAFETVASELYSVSGGQGEVWQKATALGRQLDPTNPMYGDAGSPAPHAASGEAEHADTDIYSSTAEHKPESQPEPHGGRNLDFSLDEDISLSPSSGAIAPASTPAPAFELPKPALVSDETVLNKPALVAGGAAVAAAAAMARSDKPPLHESVSFEPESVPKFDLDFHLDEPPPPLKGTPAKPASPAPEPVMAVAGGAPAPQLARPAAAIELDKLDLAFDPARSTFEDPTPSVLDGQWHDAATKLDLAKAYQEMGDVEGAREILQEVLHEGDDQQKAEAQTLIGKLA